MALPQFNHIILPTLEKNLKALLDNNLIQINSLIAKTSQPTWKNFMEPLTDIEEALEQFWSPISHLNSVKNTDELRQIYNACLPHLSDYSTALSHNTALFEKISQVPTESLSTAQQKIIANELRDFNLAGVNLPAEKKATLATLSKKLMQLCTQFEEHILDATHAWHYETEDKEEVAGIPASALASAKSAGEKGWRFTLEFPSYYPVMMHADSPALREKLYRAYVTRASDQGPTAGQFDNSEVMNAIMATRLEIAKLLGFDHYAERSLATKMVKTPTQVFDFLNHLASKAKPQAEKEIAILAAFAKERDGIDALEPWDVAYYSEKLRQAQYDLSQEDLKPYFPTPQVVEGLFAIVKRLFHINIEAIDADTWHDDVQAFAIKNADNNPIAYFYLDLYARSQKRGGAWMDSAVNRRKLADDSVQLPVAFLTCNFTPPLDGKPSLLTHNEVTTLFHEFGHGLQHMLTTIDFPEVAGINGIPWDAVEVASQFLENYAWEREGLNYIAKHVDTGEPLPTQLFERMIAAKNFQSAMWLMRQLTLALFDFHLHVEFDPAEKNQIANTLQRIREQVSVSPHVSFNRFQHSFSHIFAGGYAAGYYSYLWAEVMAADGFGRFKEHGIFDTTTAKAWQDCILAPGGAEEPAVLFKRFRGREPDVAALLTQMGIQ